MKEKELLKILFDFMNETQSGKWECEDAALDKIAKLYNKDIVDVTNTYLNYAWAAIDGKYKDSYIDSFFDNDNWDIKLTDDEITISCFDNCHYVDELSFTTEDFHDTDLINKVNKLKN